jgi:nicotinamide riboside kinase
VEVASAESFSGLTDVRNYVWLEMDFRSDANGQWGATGANGIDIIRFFDAGFRPRTEWTKVYFNLTETIIESTLDEYRFNLTTLLPPELSEGAVYLDNIKLIHF